MDDWQLPPSALPSIISPTQPFPSSSYPCTGGDPGQPYRTHRKSNSAKLHIDVGNAPLLPALFRYECLPWKQKDHKFPMFAFGMASVPARGMDRTRKAWEGNVKVSQLWWVHRHFKSSAPFDQLWKVTLFYLLGTRNSSLWMLMSLILYFWTIHYSSNKM